MALVKVTSSNVGAFIGALGVEKYIEDNKFLQRSYVKQCPLYTGDYCSDWMTTEMLCKKNCMVRDNVLGTSEQTDRHLNCCATYRLTMIVKGTSSTLYLCDSILDIEVGDI